MVRLVAEIGCNHKGSLDIAKEMISVASKVCKVEAVKFQKRNNRELLTHEQYHAPHPVPANSYGATYGEHREALEFTIDQHAELKRYCEQEGVVYSSSVWDLTSAREIASLNPDFIKVPSASNLHFELQRFLCTQYRGQIHVSVGMTTTDEIDQIVALYEDHDRARDLVLYVCTSGYPVAFDEICLLEIEKLKDLYGTRVNSIGFSGHHLGIAADVAALALGAKWVERHFTLDRTWKGTDHAASLEPDGLRRLRRDLTNVERALTFKEADLLNVEMPQRRKLKWEPALRVAS